MAPTVFENSTTLVRTTTLHVLEIEPDLHVFKREVATKNTGSTGTMKTAPEPKSAIVTQGFIDSKNLANMLAGKNHTTRGDLNILLAEGREIMRTHGYIHNISDKKIAAQAEAARRTDVYDAFATGEATADDVVRFDHSSNMLMDRHGEVLPVAILFEYISAHIDNAHYDLTKAAAHLLTRDDITVFPVKGWKDHPDFDAVANTVEEAIASIPYYNAEAGRNRTITFRWSPSVEDYRKMWAECLRIGRQYPSTTRYQAVFNLDLLGLRACGAALSDDFYAQ